MGLLRNISYAWKVSRLASSLGKTDRLISDGRFGAVAEALWDDSPRDDAKEALFKLLQATPTIQNVLEKHGADVETLRDLYDVLARRVGGWEGRHYIPVHALAFPKPLDFLLSNRYQRFAHEKFETVADNVQLQIKEYFARGASNDFQFEAR
jgi:hypothetical protein